MEDNEKGDSKKDEKVEKLSLSRLRQNLREELDESKCKLNLWI